MSTDPTDLLSKLRSAGQSSEASGGSSPEPHSPADAGKELQVRLDAVTGRPQRAGRVTPPVDPAPRRQRLTRDNANPDSKRRQLSQPSEPAERSPLPEPSSPHARVSRAGRKSKSVFVPVEAKRQLARLQFQLEETSQSLLEMAVVDLIEKYRDGSRERAVGAYNTRPDPETWIKLSVWLAKETRRCLEFLKLQYEVSFQSLLAEAIDDLFLKYRMPRIMPR